MHYNVAYNGNYHHATHKIGMSMHEDVAMLPHQNAEEAVGPSCLHGPLQQQPDHYGNALTVSAFHSLCQDHYCPLKSVNNSLKP